MNSVLLDLGFIEIKWYSICILIAFLLGYFVVLKEAKKRKIDLDYLNNLLFYAFLIAILGARIYYVLFNLDYYLSNPLEIIMINHGGLAIHGGIIAVVLFLTLYLKKDHKNTLFLTDILVVGLIMGQAIGRWGNFFNGEAYGRVVSLSFLKNLHLPNFIINGMYINNLYREPTFLYESILSLIGFIILIIIRKRLNIKTGTLTGIYLVWYGLVRFIIEIFRSDSLMLGNIKIAMVISLVGIMIGLYLIINSKSRKLYNKDEL